MCVRPGESGSCSRAAAAKQQILHAIDLVDFGRVHVAVEDDDVQILGVGRQNLVRILRFRDGAHAGAAEGRVMEGDEDLAMPAALASSSHCSSCFICSSYLGRVASQAVGEWSSYFPVHRKMKRASS